VAVVVAQSLRPGEELVGSSGLANRQVSHRASQVSAAVTHGRSDAANARSSITNAAQRD
jgi:hypothetical protein